MSEERGRESAEREKGAAPAEDFKIFVGGISWHMDDRELKDSFKRFGATDGRVMLDRQTNRSRGFGFVHFDNKADMEDAIAKMHDTEVDGRKISVTRAIPQDSIQPGTPAAAIGRRGDRGGGRPERLPPRGSYDRMPARGYERAGPYERYAGPGYERGYERPPYGAYGYEREYPPRDPYGRADPYDRYGGYPPDPYEGRGYDPYSAYGGGPGGGGGYGRPHDPYEGRGAFPDRYEPERRGGYERYPQRAGGPDRDYGRYGGGAAPRAAPYDRGAMAGRM